MSGGLVVQSGSPWNAIIGFDQSGSAVANQRPNVVLPYGQIVTGNINQWANPAAFSLPAPGTLGNMQRDTLTGPGTVNLDWSASKETQIKEQVRLQFRAEFFNLFNHPNFALPNANVFGQAVNGGATPNPTFGRVTATTTNSRQIQFGLKLLF